MVLSNSANIAVSFVLRVSYNQEHYKLCEVLCPVISIIYLSLLASIIVKPFKHSYVGILIVGVYITLVVENFFGTGPQLSSFQ